MQELLCLTCLTPLSQTGLVDNGIVHCPVCDSCFLAQEEALTYVDEIPHDEYLGG